MSPRNRLILSIIALLGVVFVGTIGYMVIEEERPLSFFEAMYMTVITVSTVYNPDPNAALEAGDTLILVGPAGVSSLLDRL